MTFRQLRIGALLLILAAAAFGTWLNRVRTTDWDAMLWVAIHPLNADGSQVSEDYIGRLSDNSFEAIEIFMRREGQRYGIGIDDPVRVELYGGADDLPPVLEPGSNPLQVAIWSLRVRWWAAHATDDGDRAPPHIRLFVLYHNPAISQSVPHSLGLQKGLLGVVHAFADTEMTGQNNIVIAHELLHTLGAGDKYDPESGQPLFPAGYADPEQVPLHPQRRAEIMAGRAARTASEWVMPDSLREVGVGPTTAAEINWMQR